MHRLAVLLVAIPTCTRAAASDAGADVVVSVRSSSVDAAPSAVPSASASANAAAEADREVLKRAKKIASGIETSVAKNTMSDPTEPGQDAKMKCAAIDELKPALEKQSDPEAKAVLESAAKLCAFDVPLLAANDVLDQLTRPRSQSSKLLFCSSAQREINAAKAVHPNDPKVRKAQARWAGLCQK